MNKRLTLRSLIFIVLLFAVAACGGDDDFEPAGVDVGNGKVTAKIAGQSWTSKDAVDGTVYANTQGTKTIQAFAEDGSVIRMTILGTINTGETIASDSGLFQASYKEDDSSTETFILAGMLGTGTIKFDTFSNSKVKGTFQFVGKKTNTDGTFDEIMISEGTFDINL